MNEKFPKNSVVKGLAWATGIACVACCAAPVASLTMGAVGLAGLGLYAEWLAVVIVAGGLGYLLLRRVMARPAPACDIAGACRTRDTAAPTQDEAR